MPRERQSFPSRRRAELVDDLSGEPPIRTARSLPSSFSIPGAMIARPRPNPAHPQRGEPGNRARDRASERAKSVAPRRAAPPKQRWNAGPGVSGVRRPGLRSTRLAASPGRTKEQKPQSYGPAQSIETGPYKKLDRMRIPLDLSSAPSRMSLKFFTSTCRLSHSVFRPLDRLNPHSPLTMTRRSAHLSHWVEQSAHPLPCVRTVFTPRSIVGDRGTVVSTWS